MRNDGSVGSCVSRGGRQHGKLGQAVVLPVSWHYGAGLDNRNDLHAPCSPADVHMPSQLVLLRNQRPSRYAPCHAMLTLVSSLCVRGSEPCDTNAPSQAPCRCYTVATYLHKVKYIPVSRANALSPLISSYPSVCSPQTPPGSLLSYMTTANSAPIGATPYCTHSLVHDSATTHKTCTLTRKKKKKKKKAMSRTERCAARKLSSKCLTKTS